MLRRTIDRRPALAVWALALVLAAATACGPGSLTGTGTAGGPPAAALHAEAGSPLRINEILVSPSDARRGEYVELVNVTGAPVALDHLVLDDGDAPDALVHRAGPALAAPHGYVLVVDPDATGPYPPGVPVLTTDDHALGNGLAQRDPVILREATGEVLDAVAPGAATGPDVARERRAPTLPDAPSSWRLVPGGSPGVRNHLAPSGLLRIHFTAPTDDSETAAAMVRFIDGAHDTLDCALYQLDDPAILDALIRAEDRGVVVRLVTDSTFYDRADYHPGYARLEADGIVVVPDERSAESHNKYLVADGRRVWLGSWNPTVHLTADAAVELVNPGLAATLAQGVDDMVHREFGPAKHATRVHDHVVDGAEVSLYVAPVDHVEDAVVAAIHAARRSVHVLAFTLTETAVGDALVDRAAHGVAVKGAVDWLHATIRGSQWRRLVDAGLPMRRTPHGELMHHKMIVIDAGTPEATLIVGSYNFSTRAETRNDETLLIIHDRRLVAAAEGAFAKVWAGSVVPDGAAPKADLMLAEVEGGATPWVELVNAGDAPAPLGGVRLADGDATVTLPAATLSPGQRAVVVLGREAPAGIADGALTLRPGALPGGLSATDPVILETGDSVPLDAACSRQLPGAGASLSRIATGWAVGAPTPGR